MSNCMVELQCPHCNEDVELDDGDSGLFNCPYCDKEFYWKSRRPGKLVTVFLTISIIFAIGSGITYYLSTGEQTTECEDCTLEESIGHSIATGLAEAVFLEQSKFCGSISGIFLLLSIIIYAAKQART